MHRLHVSLNARLQASFVLRLSWCSNSGLYRVVWTHTDIRHMNRIGSQRRSQERNRRRRSAAAAVLVSETQCNDEPSTHLGGRMILEMVSDNPDASAGFSLNHRFQGSFEWCLLDRASAEDRASRRIRQRGDWFAVYWVALHTIGMVP